MNYFPVRLFAKSAFFGLLVPVAAVAQSFTFGDFSAASLAANPLQINGNASAPVNVGGTDVLRLTPAASGQAGSAFSLNTVQLGGNASFSTAFSFQLTDGAGISDGTSNPPGADGIVFVLNTVSNSVGASGQGVGYQGVAHSVGIKFDTWADSDANGFPQDSDPNGNFVSIYTDGDTDTDGHSFYTPGASMKNGDIWYAWIDYNGLTDQLDVRLSDGVNVRPVTAQLSEVVDLSDASILGSAPQVYAGFTAGTGGAWDNQDIRTWQFDDTYQPISTVGAVPDSTSTVALLGLGMLALGWIRRPAR
jgi:hypothetical protein